MSTTLTLELPDEIAEQIAGRPDRDELVSRALQSALAASEAPLPKQAASAPTRWQLLVQRIESHPERYSLGEHDAKFRQDCREFREGFEFRHDREP